MARIICLANSYKHRGRCIAGIDIDTGRWVRPISQRTSAVYKERFIDNTIGNEPKLLDLVEIPLGERAPDEGCQPENIYLNNGTWKRLRKLSAHSINQYVEDTPNLLHNQESKVDPEIFSQIPQNRWRSLQLVSVTNPNFGLNPWGKKRCIFRYSGIRYELKITDPIVIEKITNDEDISSECLLTISLATPYKSPSYEKKYCWKMVAGVIELG